MGLMNLSAYFPFFVPLVMGHVPLTFNVPSFSLHSPVYTKVLQCPQAWGCRCQREATAPSLAPGTARAFTGVKAEAGLVPTVTFKLDVICSVFRDKKMETGLKHLSTMAHGLRQRKQRPTRDKPTPKRCQLCQALTAARC